jgi:hypothetical protein
MARGFGQSKIWVFLSLIPKIKGSSNLKKFWPIALINVILRVVTKNLASRMAHVAHSMINPCYTGFIKGMQIHDGIVVIEEVLHELRVKKILGIVLKLDFEKAYEDFFEEVLMK